jgi:hypothetical protein
VRYGVVHRGEGPETRRVRAMSNKRIRFPKEGLVGPGQPVGPGEGFIDGTTDVEGHAWTNPAPPVDFSKGMPSKGGEVVSSDDTPGPDDPHV